MATKKQNKPNNLSGLSKGQQKLALIIEVLIGLFIISTCFGGGGKSEKPSTDSVEQTPTEHSEAVEEKKEETYEERHARYIENFINVYNANCSTEPLVFVEDYDLQDKDSGHYRTEYRLNAYRDRKGAFCTIGESTTMEILGNRVYIVGDTPTVAQASLDILKLFYPDISDEELAKLSEKMSDPEEMDFANQYAPTGISGNCYFELHPDTSIRPSSAFIDGGIPLDD